MKGTLRQDGDYVFYQIQRHFDEWDKWYTMTDRYYLKEFEHGQNSASGDCWQTIGVHGIFDYEYARKYCNALNDALEAGQLNIENGLSGFRLVKVEMTQKCTILEPNRY